MYKLVIIKGPKQEFFLNKKELFIGRNPKCEIHLSSDFVSKKHARLIISRKDIVIEDLKSRNGTFVNGLMIKKCALKVGDRISFRDIILELRSQKKETLYKEKTSSSNVLKQIPEKIQEACHFLVRRIEWRHFTLALIFLLITVNFLITVPSLLRDSQTKLQLEGVKRAEFIAKHISKQNQKNISMRNGILVVDPVNLSVDFAKLEERISWAQIVNPQTKKVMTPSERLDQPIDNRGPFLRGADSKSLSVEKLNSEEILISHPIYVYSPSEEQEVVGAVVQVVFNIHDVGMSSYEMLSTSLIYLFISLLLGVAVYFLLYQYTLVSFQTISSEIEAASKKDHHEIALQTKFQEIKDVIHSINRIFQNTQDLIEKHPKAEESSMSPSDTILKNLLSSISDGILVIDQNYKILQMNPFAQKIFTLKEETSLHKNILDMIENPDLLKHISHGLGQASLGFSLEEEVNLNTHRYRLQFSTSKNEKQEIDFYTIKLTEIPST